MEKKPFYIINLPYIDSHFHLMELSKRDIPLDTILFGFNSGDLVLGLDIGIKADDLQKRKDLVTDRKELFLSLGLYPGISESKNWQEDLKLLENEIRNPKVRAVGECGLDWHWNYSTKARQIELFEAQIDLANRYNLPIIIHNRDADREVFETIQRCLPKEGGILHCFSSNLEYAYKFMDCGFLISFAGNVTYPKSEHLREVVQTLPLESLLLETDAPYLAPVPHRGKINHPEYIKNTYSFVSELRRIPLESLVCQVYENFRKFLKI